MILFVSSFLRYWLTAAVFHVELFIKIEAVVETFDSADSKAIKMPRRHSRITAFK